MPQPRDAYLAWKNDKNYLPSVPGHKMDYRRITALRLLLFFQTNMDFTVICGVIIWGWGGRVPLSCQLRVKSSHFIQIHLLHREMNEGERKFVYSFHDWRAVTLTYCYEVQQRTGECLLHSHHMWLSSQETVKSCHRWLVTDDSDCLQYCDPDPGHNNGRGWGLLSSLLCLRCPDQVALAVTDSFETFILPTDNSHSCSGLSPANSRGILMAPPRAQWSENYFFGGALHLFDIWIELFC